MIIKMAVNHKNNIHTGANAIFAKVGIFLLVLSISEASFLNYLHLTLQKVSQTVSGGSSTSREWVYKDREILNPSKHTNVEWEMLPELSPNSTIPFRFSTSLTNYNENGNILLGQSKTSQANGENIVVMIRVAPAGELPKLVDMHGVNNSTIFPDSSRNWKLDFSDQNSLQVYFLAARIFDTSDEHEAEVQNDLPNIIWGYTEANTDIIKSLSFTLQRSLPECPLDPSVPSSAVFNTSSNSKDNRVVYFQ